MNRYSVSALIGEGSFGRVYKATRKEDDQVVAIKVISKRGRTSRDLKNLRRECDIQAHLKHPNIIEMLESFETRNDLVVVTEFALIDLHRYMKRNGALSEEKAQRLIANLVSALYYLHSNRILHRDLKPQNVLLNEDLHAKLCDFGLARNMTMGTHVLTSIKGTPLYMAPELLSERPYDHQADMWSLGCIAYESMVGQPPFCTTSILHLVKMIKHEDVKWPSFMSSACRSFLQGLLEKDPAMRIAWAQILCHPFVDGKLYIAVVKAAESSPFINPQKSKSKSNKEENKTISEDLSKKISSLTIENSLSANENLTTSKDSINAIPPSDIENLETDFEDAISVPFADCIGNYNQFVAPRKAQPFSTHNILADPFRNPTFLPANPVINSQTCFVSGNNNMVLNYQDDNLAQNNNAENLKENLAENLAACKKDLECNISAKVNANMGKSRNKDLEKRKLSQNLDNFSVRLAGEGSHKSVEAKQESAGMTAKKERHAEKLKEKDKDTKQSQQSSDNSPPCLLPGWDSCDSSQSPPIENDEWLAFLYRSMQEVLDGELESLKQHNLVSIIVAPLRNSKAIPKVIDSVAQLLSLPFVLGEPSAVLEQIKSVYVDVKLVPNLMYASKLLMCQKNTNDSSGSQSIHNAVRAINELSGEEIRTASRLYELVTHLVHLKQQFLLQFCDAVAILSANDQLITCLSHDFKNANAVRLSNCVLGLLCCVLRELPENAELVEKIIFNAKLNLIVLFENKNDLLRTRLCMLFRLLARFSLRGLQAVWCSDIKRAIERAADDNNEEVREEAESTLQELRQFSFYG